MTGFNQAASSQTSPILERISLTPEVAWLRLMSADQFTVENASGAEGRRAREEFYTSDPLGFSG